MYVRRAGSWRACRGGKPHDDSSFARSLGSTAERHPLAVGHLLASFSTTRVRRPLTTPPPRDMFALATSPTSPYLGARASMRPTAHGTREISAHRQGARRSSTPRDPRAAVGIGRDHLWRRGGRHFRRAVDGVAPPAYPRRFRARIRSAKWTTCAVPRTARKSRGVPDDAASAAPTERRAPRPPGQRGTGDRVVMASVAPTARTRCAGPHLPPRESFASHIDGCRCIDRAAGSSRNRTSSLRWAPASAVRTLRTGVKPEPQPPCRKCATPSPFPR